MPRPIEIVPATPGMLPQLSALLGLLFAQESDFAPDPAAQLRGLEMIIDAPAFGRILVAKQGDEVLGMVGLLFTLSTALGAKVAMLEDMVVTPAARGEGIGGRLLEAAVALAEREGCRRVTLLTDGDNLSAQRFYASHGFNASAMRPWRRLLGDQG
ncbi:GNAT family N-acetyltransferase [Halotalea alkalilenta]|uniref:GNAT family N-acetyltransferase n=1 Tax=Halotalea alkalilenta TaxID=376489 RepID=UPI000A9E61C6|nr:GNAT family N-acetyltransferase [Halotalea alkalilenta]